MRARDPGTSWGPAPQGLSQECLQCPAGTENFESGTVTGLRGGALSPSGTLRGSRSPLLRGVGGGPGSHLDFICPRFRLPSPSKPPNSLSAQDPLKGGASHKGGGERGLYLAEPPYLLLDTDSMDSGH